MSRKYLNNRWCSRCHKDCSTPYIRKHMDKIHGKKVLDLGCGNGRNSDFFREMGCDVTSADMIDDYEHSTMLILGKDDLPAGNYDIILANYVLMFLDDRERGKVMKQINDIAKKGSFLIVEIYDAKDSYHVDTDVIYNYFVDLNGWEKVHKVKDKFIVQK
jgi:2-polyprenyl-3-methyl-5-hydroxy-6-metoxy-1,4-benzoquinol methylase